MVQSCTETTALYDICTRDSKNLNEKCKEKKKFMNKIKIFRDFVA